MDDKQRTLEHLQSEANTAKDRLIEIMGRLEEAGLRRRARELGTIISRLEEWQHKGV